MTDPVSRSEEDLVGTRITPDLRVTRRLGSGTNGAVWAAHDERTGTEVAVKLPPDFADEEARARFEREAATASSVRGPHVVEVQGRGTWARGPYMVMELLQGEDLAARLAREGRLSIALTRRIVSQTARALSRAHEAGVIHRDIKPANIFLCGQGDDVTIKVLDFGFAKTSVSPVSQTRSGDLFGTPHFMSPEQAQSTKHVTPATDAWSLAVVAYRCLTGKLPFEASSLVSLCFALEAGRFTPPSEIVPELGTNVDAFFERALHPSPDERFSSVDELDARLDQALSLAFAARPTQRSLPEHGETFAGKYAVEAVIGRGGMGVVLRARHLILDEPVALKVIARDRRLPPDALARFFREGKAAAKIRSEHVARVLDVDTSDGVPFLVLEYLEGEDLATRIARSGPLEISACVHTLLEACDALSEAHARGIIHRDIKPQNLFLARRVDGTECTKVLDFGIAKVAETLRDADAPSETTDARLLGTPFYLSPEQIRSGRKIDGRADVWALGVVAYEALTGETPFQGDGFGALCGAILQDDPAPPSTKRPAVPAALDAIVLRCLEKRADNRFPSVAALASALATLAGPEGAAVVARIERVQKSLAAGTQANDDAERAVRADAPTVAQTGGTWQKPELATTTGGRPPRALWAGAVLACVTAAGIGVYAVGARATDDRATPSNTVSVASAPLAPPQRSAQEPPARVAAPEGVTSAAPPSSASSSSASSASSASSTTAPASPAASAGAVAVPPRAQPASAPRPTRPKAPAPDDLFSDPKN